MDMTATTEQLELQRTLVDFLNEQFGAMVTRDHQALVAAFAGALASANIVPKALVEYTDNRTDYIGVLPGRMQNFGIGLQPMKRPTVALSIVANCLYPFGAEDWRFTQSDGSIICDRSLYGDDTVSEALDRALASVMGGAARINTRVEDWCRRWPDFEPDFAAVARFTNLAVEYGLENIIRPYPRKNAYGYVSGIRGWREELTLTYVQGRVQLCAHNLGGAKASQQ
jgi:hypothetical protein